MNEAVIDLKTQNSSEGSPIVKINEVFETSGYFAEENLLWNTYLNYEKILNTGTVGQGIHAICLEGPPGSGKTFYANHYPNVINHLLNEEIILLQHQCDGTTGKTELYEEIRISAAVTGNGKDVLIPGILTEAIELVNKGKKVIVFLDEYDKAKTETDAFLLSFLQEGKINTTQKGRLYIDSDKLKNIQVILCKNESRKELSGPLERRLKIVKLDFMKPDKLIKVINRELPNVNEDLKDLVNVLYAVMYAHRDDFKRIPACSEILKTLKDVDILIKMGAPQNLVYNELLSNLLKDTNDLKTFIHYLIEDKDLKIIGNELDKVINKKSEDVKELSSDLISLIMTKKMPDINQKINDLSTKNAYLRNEIERLKNEIEEIKNPINKNISVEIQPQKNENDKLINSTTISEKKVEISHQNINNNKTISASEEFKFVKKQAEIVGASSANGGYKIGYIDTYRKFQADKNIYSDSSFSIDLFEEKFKDEKNTAYYRYHIISNLPVTPVNIINDVLTQLEKNELTKRNYLIRSKINCLVPIFKGITCDSLQQRKKSGKLEELLTPFKQVLHKSKKETVLKKEPIESIVHINANSLYELKNNQEFIKLEKIKNIWKNHYVFLSENTAILQLFKEHVSDYEQYAKNYPQYYGLDIHYPKELFSEVHNYSIKYLMDKTDLKGNKLSWNGDILKNGFSLVDTIKNNNGTFTAIIHDTDGDERRVVYCDYEEHINDILNEHAKIALEESEKIINIHNRTNQAEEIIIAI